MVKEYFVYKQGESYVLFGCNNNWIFSNVNHFMGFIKYFLPNNCVKFIEWYKSGMGAKAVICFWKHQPAQIVQTYKFLGLAEICHFTSLPRETELDTHE